MPTGFDAIDATLHTLSEAAMRRDATLQALARELARGKLSRGDQITAFVDELHRRFIYAPDPADEVISLAPPFEPGTSVDVDDACMFVGALASHVGIPVRFIAARVKKHSWTMAVIYEDEEGFWTGVDVLRHSNVPPIEEIRS